LFDLLGYHRREAKPAWWEYFAPIERTDEQLRDEDAEAIGDLTPSPARVARTWRAPTCGRSPIPSMATCAPG
jgi:uncharacterized protein